MYRPMKSDKRFFLSLIRGSECAVNLTDSSVGEGEEFPYSMKDVFLS